MRIRFLRLTKFGIIAVLLAGTIVVIGHARQQVNAYWPDFSRREIGLLSPDSSGIWDEPDQGVQRLAWTNRSGAMMGRVTAKTWKKYGRIYYCIEGPIFLEPEGNEKPFVVCEAIYPNNQGQKVQQFYRNSASICWYANGLAVARGKVSESTYQITEREGVIHFVFWTTQPVRNLAFYYCEEGQCAWASMDRLGAPNRIDPKYWSLQ